MPWRLCPRPWRLSWGGKRACGCVCIYIYIYIERERYYIYIYREREICLYTYIYIYIYIYTYSTGAGGGFCRIPDRGTVSPRTKKLDFGGFDSSRKGWNSQVRRELPRNLDSEIPSLQILSLRIGRAGHSRLPCSFLQCESCSLLYGHFRT